MAYYLDSTSFQALLGALRPDSADSAGAYEQLREKLIRFFRWNNCRPEDELADLAIDRLAGRLREDAGAISDPVRFALGIARMVVHEHRIRTSRQEKAHSGYVLAKEITREEEEEQRLETLERCLNELDLPNRSILERYYTGDAGERIRNRRQLAAEMGLNLNALRNRALRLRRELENRIEQQLRDQERRDKSVQNGTLS